MRIAQVVPPWLSIPPHGYGGVESVVSDLTETLVRRGHEVTLFATGDSKTQAKLSYVYDHALGNDGTLKDNPYVPFFQLQEVFTHADAFDVIHIHNIEFGLFFAQYTKTPCVHTLHGTLMPGEIPEEKRKVYETLADQNYISISNAQRKGMPALHYISTVYNGIPMEQFTFREEKGSYLAFLGRITPKKGILEAIETAKRVGMPLKIAAVVDPIEQSFFESKVKPLFSPSIEFIGELHDKERDDFLSHAFACLVPVKWHEPFGLVITESMACGTPVIACSIGSIPEIVVHAKTGFIVPFENTGPLITLQESIVSPFVDAVNTLRVLPDTSYRLMRKAARARVEEQFSLDHMVDGYEEAYRMVSREKTK